MNVEPRATSAALAEALFACGPQEGHETELMQFGRLAGCWRFEGHYDTEDGTRIHDTGDITIGWVLGGQAVQDVWRETYRSVDGPLSYGTTIRFYDASIGLWRSTWIDPVHGAVRTFIGHATADGMVFEGNDGQGHPLRWIFSEVEENSFTWHAERRDTQGEWVTCEALRALRATPAEQSECCRNLRTASGRRDVDHAR